MSFSNVTVTFLDNLFIAAYEVNVHRKMSKAGGCGSDMSCLICNAVLKLVLWYHIMHNLRPTGLKLCICDKPCIFMTSIAQSR